VNEFVPLVFHSIIYAYQKTIRETLGSTDTAILKLIDTICENIRLLGIDFNAGFENAVKTIIDKSAEYNLGEVTLEKIEGGGYLFRVKHCPWAPYLHKQLKPKDVTCPRALIAMAAFQASTGEIVYVADSEYSEDGTATRIEAVSTIERELKQIG